MAETETTTRDAPLTETELRNAGASATYIAYYLAATELGIETNSTKHAERVVREGVAYSGGGFHDSLWNAEPRYQHRTENPYGADDTNSRILREAGIFPYAERP